MAKGYPDFFGTSIWPKYGTPLLQLSAFEHILDGGTTTMLTITEQGVVTDIFATFSCIGGSDYIYLELVVDGNSIQTIDMRAGSDLVSSGSASRMMAVLYDNRITGEIYAVLTKDLPFRSSVVIKVNNEANVAIDAQVQVVHYVVT